MIALSVVLAGTATAAPTPNAGGDRSVDLNSLDWYTGTDASGEGVTFGWSFAGSIVNGQSVQFAFQSSGSFAVSFWADDGIGNNVSDPITVTVADISPPLADAGADSFPNEDSVFTFDASGSSDNDPTFPSTGVFTWTFTEYGTPRTLTGQMASYTFVTPGTFDVTLTVEDAAGNSAADTMRVTARDITPPAASAGSDRVLNEDVALSFDGVATTDNDPVFASTGRYYWTFSDSNVSISLTGTTPAYTFVTPGVYIVNLVVFDATGNFGTDTVLVTVRDTTNPVADIIGGATQTFDEDTVQTMDASNSTDNDPYFYSSSRFYWTFTDGTAKNLSGRTVMYTFAQPGTFLVTLKAMDAAGNWNTATTTFVVLDVTHPVVNATIANQTFNEDTVQTLVGTGSMDNVAVVNWTWVMTDAGVNATLYGSTVMYTWTTPGEYGFTLQVRDAAGHNDTVSFTVTVLDITPPSGSGSVPSSSAQNSLLTFSSGGVTDNDLTFGTSGRAWWTFDVSGSPVNITGRTVFYSFGDAGTYTITLTVRDAAWNIFTQDLSVSIYADATPPSISIDLASKGQSKEIFSTVSFSGSASDDDAVAGTWWLIDDGSERNITGSSITAFFGATGNFTIRFFARDNAWNIVSASTNVLITADMTAPSGSASVPASWPVGTTVTFNATGITDNDPSLATTGQYDWTFALDNTTNIDLSGRVVTFTFSQTGTFSVNLLVKDAAGNLYQHTFGLVIFLDVTPPVPAIAPGSQGQSKEQFSTVSFDGTATDNVGVVEAWWIFNNGTAQNMSGDSFSAVFASTGTYTITYYARDGRWNIGSTSTTLTVVLETTPPVGNFTGGATQMFNEDVAVSFDASNSMDNDPSFPATGTFTWSFTDGGLQTLTGKMATYTFANPGTFVVTLTVLDAAGNAAAPVTLTLTIEDVTGPVSSWTIVTPFDEDTTQTLDGTGSTDYVGVVSYNWTIGDYPSAVTELTASVTHTWASPGMYAVTLTTKDAAGNTGTLTRTVTVRDLTFPTGTATVPALWPQNGAAPFNAGGVTDNDPSFATTRRDYWTFTDGTLQNLSGSMVTYTFASTGTYAVTLVTMDSAGHKLTQSFSINIWTDASAPTANAGSDQVVNEDTVVTLDASGSTDNDPLFATTGKFTWTFDDNGVARTLVGRVSTFTFATPGRYIVTLSAQDAAGFGVFDMMVVQVRDVTAPTARAGADQSVNEDLLVTFDASATTDNDPMFSTTGRFYWTFYDNGAAMTRSGRMATYTFATPGRYNVSLLTIDAAGNMATDLLYLTIRDTTLPSPAITGGTTQAVDEDAPFTLDASATTDNDPRFTITGQYFWTFTDGTSQMLTGQTLVYTFVTPGTFMITLTVVDEAGNAKTSVLTLTVRDITAPLLDLNATFLDRTLEQYSLVPFNGTASDNAGVAASWWIFNNGTAQNVSGLTILPRFDVVGTYTVTLYVRDAAWNVASVTTSLTITADVSAPNVSFITAPTIGDDRNALVYDAMFSDNNPACASTCTLTWLQDGVSVATGVSTVTVLWSPGRHTLVFTVRDAAGNTGNATAVVDIDQVVASDFMWDGLPVTMSWNLRIVNGATLTIRNSVVHNTNTGVNVTINVLDGRLVVEGSTIESVTANTGFKIMGSAADGARVVMFFNGSRVSGLYDWVSVTNGTLSATDSTFEDARQVDAGLLRGIDSSIYLTNVTLDATGLTTTSGVEAQYTSRITLYERREVIIERLHAQLVSRTPFHLTADGVVGTVDVTLRDSQLRTTNPDVTVFAVDLKMKASSGTFSYKLQNVDAQDALYGGLSAVHDAFTGTVTYNVTDSMFDGATNANGMYFLFRGSSAVYSVSMATVSSRNNGQSGISYIFDTSGTNKGAITMRDLEVTGNALDGVYTSIQSSPSTVVWSLESGQADSNGRNGLFFDTAVSVGSELNVWLGNTSANGNQFRGIWYNSQSQRVNASFDLNMVTADGNLDWGMWAFSAEISLSGMEMSVVGQLYLNLTQSSFSNNGAGGLYVNNSFGNMNVTGRWTDTVFDMNTEDGVYMESKLRMYTSGDLKLVPMFNATIVAERISASRNLGNGIVLADSQTGSQQCCWSTYAPSGLYDVSFNNSHFDRNNGMGFFHNNYCCEFYGAALIRIKFMNSTANLNSGTGLYNYIHAYVYAGFGGGGARATQMDIQVFNSSVSDNGPQGEGISTESNQYAVGASTMFMEIKNSTVVRNGHTGVRVYWNYAYQSGSFVTNIYNSNLSNNGGRGYEATYSYMESSSGGVWEHIENVTFMDNGFEAILHGYPGDWARYNVPWSLEYLNNTIDRVSTNAIATTVVSSSRYFYASAERFNITGNRITNVRGAAVSFSFEPPRDGESIYVDFSRNYIADTDEGVLLAVAGSTNNQHTWIVKDNAFERTTASALVLAMNNRGPGNLGALFFENNTFRQTGGAALTLTQSSIKSSTLTIKDCVFDTQRTAMELSSVTGSIDNATFIGSIKDDVSLTSGTMDIHNTLVDVAKLRPNGAQAAFNVWFHMKAYVVWSGSGKPAVGAISELADAMGGIIFVGSVLDANGLPELELWSYTKTASGVLGRTPFRLQVTYFELIHQESIDLLSDRVVTIVLVDNVAPAVVVASPQPGFGTQSDSIKVEGTAYDSQSGFAFDLNNPQLPGQYVELSVDNVTWVQAHVKSSSAFEVQFDYTFTGLSESTRAIYVRVHDDSDNFALRVIPVKVDRTAPIVTILSPLTSSLVTNALSIRLSAETEVGTLVLVNGLVPPEIFTRPDGVHVYFVMDIPVFEGPQTVTVVAIDTLNNQGNASIFVLVDRQAPYLAVLSPVADALVKESDVTVEGLTEASGVTVTVNGQVAAVNAVTGSFRGSVHLSTDINRIQIQATDEAGNVQLVVREVRLDTTVPWINVQSPASNALLNSPEVDVVGIVEPGSRLIVNDEVVNAPTGAFQRRILLTEGPNTIVFVAVDAAGNTWERDVFVTVDTQRPTLEITSPANEVLWNRSSVLLTGSVTDEHTPMLRVNGQDVAVNADGSFQVAMTLYEGTNFVTLEATDGAKNVNTKVWTVIRDTEKPFLVSSLEGAFFEGVALKTYNSTVTVTGYTERGSVLEVCSLNAQGREVCNAIPLAADGGFRTFVDLRLKQTNDITVTSTDAAGNTISRNLQLMQAPVPPPVEKGVDFVLVSLYGLGAAILVGSFFLLYMRRGKGGSGTQLAELESTPGQVAMAQPELEAVRAAPELSVQSDLGAPAVALSPPQDTAGEAGASPEAEGVPAAPSRARPMRRRPIGSSGEDTVGSLTGMGAEDEAKPGDTHQSGEEENKGA